MKFISLSLLFLSFMMSLHCEKLVVVHLQRMDVRKARKKLAFQMNFMRKEQSNPIFMRPSALRVNKVAKKVFAAQISESEKNMKVSKVGGKTFFTYKDNYSVAKIYLMNYADIQYWGNIALGKNQEKFNVLFDTGSSWTWIPAKNCKNCKNAGMKHSFSCSNSDSCKKDPMEVSIEYGKGSIEGEIARDSVYFDGKEVSGQPFLMVEKVSSDMPGLMFDGLVGLSPSEKMLNYQSFLTNMKDKGVIDKSSFSIFLSKKEKVKGKAKPVVIFGGYKESYSKEPLHFCNRLNDSYWSVPMNGINLINDDVSTKLDISADRALLDTGTSLITLPEDDFKKLFGEIQKMDSSCFFSQDDFEIVCPKTKDKSKLPNISFSLCGKNFDLSPSDYSHNENTSFPGATSIKIGFVNLGSSAVILGDPFLQAFYSYYDLEDNKIGLAEVNRDAE